MSDRTHLIDRIAIVGLGAIGNRHLQNLRQICPHANIAVCRLSESAKQASVAEGADRLFHTLDDLLSFRPQVAIISTPATTHEQIARTLASAGVNLFIEKPIAHSMDSADKISDVVSESKVIAMVGYNLRFMPGLRKIKTMIDGGEIGQVLSVRAEVGQYLPDWRPGQDYRNTVSANKELGGGALLELSHEIDYLLWLLGMPDLVNAAGGNTGTIDVNVEDLIEIWLKYDSGPLVSVHLDFLDRAGYRSLRVMGDLGSVVWNAMNDSVTRFGPDHRQGTVVETESLSDRNQPYILEMKHFLECAEDGCEPSITVAQACDVISIVHAAKKSLQLGQQVKVMARVGAKTYE